MSRIFNKIRRLKHFLLSKIFQNHTVRLVKSIEPAAGIINAFEKVKNNSHSNEDKKILNFLDEYRLELSANNNKINFKEIGNNNILSVSEIAIKAASTKKWTAFFYHLAKTEKIKNVLEIGTNLGVSGQYFLKAIEKKINSIFFTLEGIKNLCNIATDRFNLISDNNRFRVIHGLYDEKLLELNKLNIKFDLVFIDGNHQFEATIKYYELLKNQFAQNAIVIFDDIHWSNDMTDAWKRIIRDDCVYLSIDFYKLGIIIYNKQKSKSIGKHNLFLSH